MGVTVADARFMKPLDVDLIRRLAREHDAMLTVEENAIGGFGAHVLHFMVLDGLMDDVSVLVTYRCIIIGIIVCTAKYPCFCMPFKKTKNAIGSMHAKQQPRENYLPHDVRNLTGGGGIIAAFLFIVLGGLMHVKKTRYLAPETGFCRIFNSWGLGGAMCFALCWCRRLVPVCAACSLRRFCFLFFLKSRGTVTSRLPPFWLPSFLELWGGTPTCFSDVVRWVRLRTRVVISMPNRYAYPIGYTR